MLEKFKEHKLRIAIVVIAACLIFYAVGNATNFFGNPAFRMFWIISDETAHSVAIYAAIAGAVAVVVIGLTVTLIKKRKTPQPHTTYDPAIIKPQTTYKPVIPNIKANNQTPVKTTFPTYPTYKPVIPSIKPTNQMPIKTTWPTYKQKMNDKTKENKIEQKNEPIKQPVIKLAEQSTAQEPAQPATGENKTNNQKIETNMPANGKFSCPKCRKEFSTPLFMLEYVQSKPKLVRHCPYCDESLD